MLKPIKILFLTGLLSLGTSLAQPLPDPLIFNDGRKVETATQWQELRAEMRTIIEDEAIGHMPAPPEKVSGTKIAEVEIFGGEEGLEDVVGKFPHWFGSGLEKYSGKVDELPFDQHWLIAMVAPRKFIAADGLQDPYTSKIAVKKAIEAARPTFEKFGVSENLSLHFRQGKHLFAEEDWTAVLDFVETLH